MGVALRMCGYFESSLEFVDVADTHTPDVLVSKTNQRWEIKAINGSSKNTIHHTLARAKKQSENVILVVNRSRLYKNQIIGQIKSELKKRREIKRLVVVMKDGEIFVIKGKV